MVHIETQKVKVLRANQKNAKCLWALHPPTEATAGPACPKLLWPRAEFTRVRTSGVQGFGLGGFRVQGFGFRALAVRSSGFKVQAFGLISLVG